MASTRWKKTRPVSHWQVARKDRIGTSSNTVKALLGDFSFLFFRLLFFFFFFFGFFCCNVIQAKHLIHRPDLDS